MKLLFGLIITALQLIARSQTTDTSDNSPKHAVAWLNVTSPCITYEKGKGGESGAITLFAQHMYFDSQDKSTGPERYGAFYKHVDTPVVTALGFGSVSYQNTWKTFANIEIDLSNIQVVTNDCYTNGLWLFSQWTTSREHCCEIYIAIANHKSVIITTNFQVFYDGERTLDPEGPFVTLRCELHNPADKSTSITILRNGKQILKTFLQQFADGKGLQLKGTQTKDDVLEWNIRNDKGLKIKKGLMGFPVVGAIPNTVQYEIDLWPTLFASPIFCAFAANS